MMLAVIVDPTTPERRLSKAYPMGRLVDLRAGDAQLDDPAGHLAWGPERAVRAEALAALLLGPAPTGTGRVARLRLRGARITGEFHLPFADVPVAVEFEDCAFDSGVRFTEATIRGLQFVRCHLPYLDLDTVAVRNHLGMVGSHLGPVSLYNASVGGQLDLSGAELTANDQTALNGELMHVGGTVYAQDLVVHGAVELPNATVAGQLVLDRAHLAGADGVALTATALSVGGNVHVRDAHIQGQVTLRGARIGGSLDLSRTHLERPGGEALSASRVSIGHDLTAEATQVDGIRLHGTRIDGAIELRDARLQWPGRAALSAYRLTVGGGVFCQGAFESNGRLNLPSSQIVGTIVLSGTIGHASGVAVNLNGSAVEGNLEAPDGVRIHGTVSLWQTVVTGQVNLAGAALTNPNGQVLNARHLRTRALILGPHTQLDGEVDVRGAALGVLRDDPAHWPRAIRLDGATYDTVEPALPARLRLAWLRRHSDGYLPQTYEQLASTYRRLGHDGDARAVLAAKQRHRHESSSLPVKAWGYLQDGTVGYGYRPVRAGAWLLALLVLGTVMFAQYPPHRIGPGPAFHPFVYTADVLLPIVDFGQQGAYQPGGGWQWLAYGLTAAGWVLATTVAAGITRALRRQ
jgi:cytoskeletal protein CcmA (bactofilin family)